MKKHIILFFILTPFSGVIVSAQNIAVNTTGTAAAATNMFEVTQTSTTANTVGMYSIHSGAISGTGYALYATKTGASTTNIGGYFNASGATNNYGIIVPSGGGNVGIGTSAPTNILSLGGNAAQILWMERHTTANTAGNSLTLQAGGATSGATNKAGGDLILAPGASTGSGGSNLIFKTYPATAASTTDNAIAERMRINSSGFVGIGTTSPQQPLHIAGTGSASYPYRGSLIVEADQAYSTGSRIVSHQYAAGSGIACLRTDGSLASPSALASGDVIGIFNFGGYDGSTWATYSGIQAYATGNYTTTSHPTDIRFYVTDVNDAGGVLQEVMRIKNNGNVGIGLANPSYLLSVDGQPGCNGYTTFTNYSDARLKRNVCTIENSLGKIMKLRPVQFNYNEEYLNLYNDTASLSRLQKGFIAQEVKEIFPEMVGKKNVNGKEYYDLNLSNLQVYMVKAMQEQQVEIERLKKMVAQLMEISEPDKINQAHVTHGASHDTKKLHP